jgi:Na+/H+ antiporter NhaD/arsenite permease-like protein
MLKWITGALSVLVMMASGSALAAGAGAPHLDGADLGLMWVIPFAGILLSIAIMPLVAPDFWHHHFGKISVFWAAAFLIPFVVVFGASIAIFEVVHVLLLEYVPFIILLLSLFTVAGGVRVRGRLVGTPVLNTSFLVIGTILASMMGTTGAAMLLIRPLMRANEKRRYRVHTIVFFIFLVANVGGSLTPLGDPPLFLGFLKGVDFFWPTTHMLAPMLLVSGILLVLYFIVDTALLKKEGGIPAADPDEPVEAFGLDGKLNFILLGGVIAAVLMSGIWKPGIELVVYHVHWELQNIARDVSLLAIAFMSWKITPMINRTANGFTWFPIMEVGKLFAGIFLTIVPAIAILKAGLDGALSGVVNLVTTPAGEPINQMYFWMTGILSSFLDNAPTYLVFFNTAGGDPQQLMGPMSQTLLAISAGAVFMGANTYIGNAPNFMVRAIAEEGGIKMPSFFGYMAWSGVILVPCLVLVSFVFFA